MGGAVRDELLQGLLKDLPMELPESLLDSETNSVANGIANDNMNRGVPRELIESKKDEILANARTSATNRVRAAFLLNRIAEEEKITFTREELANRLMFLAQQNNTEPEKFIKWAKENNRFPEIQQELLTSKVLDFIEAAAERIGKGADACNDGDAQSDTGNEHVEAAQAAPQLARGGPAPPLMRPLECGVRMGEASAVWCTLRAPHEGDDGMRALGAALELAPVLVWVELRDAPLRAATGLSLAVAGGTIAWRLDDHPVLGETVRLAFAWHGGGGRP